MKDKTSLASVLIPCFSRSLQLVSFLHSLIGELVLYSLAVVTLALALLRKPRSIIMGLCKNCTEN